VIDGRTGKPRWKDVERAVPDETVVVNGKVKTRKAGKKAAEEALKSLQGAVDEGRFKPSATTVVELLEPRFSLAAEQRADHVGRDLIDAVGAEHEGHVCRRCPCSSPLWTASDLAERVHAASAGQETVAKLHRHLHAMFEFGELPSNPAELRRRLGPKQCKHKGRGIALTAVQEKLFMDACPDRLATVLPGGPVDRSAPRGNDRATLGRCQPH
jgi:hypothetical protein